MMLPLFIMSKAKHFQPHCKLVCRKFGLALDGKMEASSAEMHLCFDINTKWSVVLSIYR
jgi:hypothetical protein